MKEKINIAVITILMSVSLVACTESNIIEPVEEISISELTTTINNFAYENPTDLQAKGLQFMREEEKLAHDVYTEMYNKYRLRAFANILKSEQTHTEAIKALLTKYSLEDPVKNYAVGIFINKYLQSLYTKLIAGGNVSEIEALKVGAAIEEIDILDLQKHIAELTNNTDIKFIYENLMRASENHLKAFVRNISSRGVVYTPQYLDKATYDSYIN